LAAVGAKCAQAESKLRPQINAAVQAHSEGPDGLPRLLSLTDLPEATAAALTTGLTALEAAMDPLPLEVVREGHVGFWRLRLTTCPGQAQAGVTGYGSPSAPPPLDQRDCSSAAAVVAHYQCYTRRVEGSLMPTLQTVEVIADGGECAVAALKGDFDVASRRAAKGGGAAAAAGSADVVEDYSWREYAGTKQLEPPPARTLECTYLTPTFRISRDDDGTLWVYEKVEADVCTGEIASLVAASA